MLQTDTAVKDEQIFYSHELFSSEFHLQTNHLLWIRTFIEKLAQNRKVQQDNHELWLGTLPLSVLTPFFHSAPHTCSHRRMGDRDSYTRGTRVYVGGLNDIVKKEDLESEFEKYGKLNSVWVAFNPPGFAFIEFANEDEAETACDNLNGGSSRGSSRGGSRGRYGDDYGSSRGGGGYERNGGRDSYGSGGGGGSDYYGGGRDSSSRYRSRSPVGRGRYLSSSFPPCCAVMRQFARSLFIIA
ncbi:unnamed protein product [Timema podura]|uniref:RRM domain-containing protein n=1 Tax=Timema podura TaxID=61482 RepID=A0ABN7NUD4_TIMPD|nr:unnamed protein product [Timema podura]